MTWSSSSYPTPSANYVFWNRPRKAWTTRRSKSSSLTPLMKFVEVKKNCFYFCKNRLLLLPNFVDVQSDLYVQMKDAMSAVQEAPDTIENILLQLLPSMEPPKEEEEEEPDDKRGRDSVDSRLIFIKVAIAHHFTKFVFLYLRQSLKLSVVRAAGMRITCHKHHPLVVKPGFVLKALSDFIINYYQVHGL